MEQRRKPPWQSFKQLLELRDMLYQQSADKDDKDDNAKTRDRQLEACTIIATLEQREPLPHSVTCTALLVEAQLCQSNESLSLTAVRAIYASAISRFVTGFVDIVRGNNTRPNMYDEARKLGMPTTWVDIRHAIAHARVLPCIEVFESVTDEALAWLWEHFWKDLERAKPRAPFNYSLRYYGIDMSSPPARDLWISKTGGQQQRETIAEKTEKYKAVRAILVKCLSDYVKDRLLEIRTNASHKAEATRMAAPVILDCCRGRERMARRVAAIAVDVKFMIPDERKPGDSMQGAFLIWRPLLATLASRMTFFRSTLLSYMVCILAESDALHARPEPFREAVYEWTLALLPGPTASPVTTSLRKPHVHGVSEWMGTWSVVMNQCVGSPPTVWTQRLVGRMLGDADEGFRRRWQRYSVSTG